MAAKARYREYLDGELEAAATYEALARREPDAGRSETLLRLAQAERRHGARWAEKLGVPFPEPGRRHLSALNRLLLLASRLVGARRIIPYLVMAEAKDIRRYSADPEARDIAAEEREHARTLKVMSGVSTHPVQEPGHRTGDGGTIRAAVLGANDGLVSNLSLVMGVAGGVDNADFVVLAGVAGLLAGAFSMAAGEYVSMRSQREIYEHQIRLEKAELEEWPEEEEEELALIYEAKGLPRRDAERVAAHLMANPALALDTMIREELGLNPDDLGSPWAAAISSFVAFAGGAILPVIPYLAGAGGSAFVLSAVVSGVGLLLVGGVVALASGRGVTWGALRMLLVGGAAAAVTFGIGTLIGVQLD